MSNKDKSYEQLQTELEEILKYIQDADNQEVELEKLLKKYQRGEEIITLMQKHLDTAKNTIKKVKE